MIYMTEKQFSMLNRFQNGEVYHFWNDPQTDEVVRYLIDNGLCTAREDIAPDMIMLTEKGKAVLDGENKRANKERKHEANQRFQNQVSVAQVLVSCITFVLGLIVEYNASLIPLILDFLGRWVK